MAKNKEHGGNSGHDDHHHDLGTDDLGVRLKGTNGDNVLTGTELNDILFGRAGNDLLTGLGGNDMLKGGKGDDRLLGGDGNDRLDGGKGNDVLDGGAGNDIVKGGKGNDVAIYTLAENLGAHDVYDGGKGFDTLRLMLTSAEQQAASADIAAFKAFLWCHVNSHGDDGKTFQFKSFDLDVRNFEKLEIVTIGGNAAPVAHNDAYSVNEDTVLLVPAPGVLANDTDPDHLDVLAVTGADAASARGAVVLVGADGNFSYDPTAALTLQQLAQGVTVSDSFNYTIEDQARATSTATVNVTVTGVNDKPVAFNDSNTTNEDTPVTSDALTNVLANDTDVDAGDKLHVGAVNGDPGNVGVQITLASGALLTMNADGSYIYNPNGQFEFLGAGDSATDIFTYVASDLLTASSETTTVKLTITGVDDAPSAIRVAVVGGSQILVENNNAASQLSDSTLFNIVATPILVTAHATLDEWKAEFAGYDVVVVGENGGTSDYDGTQIFSALRDFVNLGHGVITTGIFAGKIESYSDATIRADADYISPAARNPAGTGSQFAASGSTITIANPHPDITGSIDSYAAQGLHEVAAAVDDVNKVLAVDSLGRAAIAYDDAVGAGLGRTVFLGSIHMAAQSFPPFDAAATRTGDVDKIFEQAVVWAAGGGSSTLLGASLTSLASAAPSGGDELFLGVEEPSFDFGAQSPTGGGTDAGGTVLASLESDYQPDLPPSYVSPDADALI